MIVRVSIRQDANPHAYYKCMICPHCKKDSRVLTDRNKEILLQLCNGLSNKEIGKIVGIKERTVKMHIARAIKVLQVKNRVQVAIVYKMQRDKEIIEENNNEKQFC